MYILQMYVYSVTRARRAGHVQKKKKKHPHPQQHTRNKTNLKIQRVASNRSNEGFVVNRWNVLTIVGGGLSISAPCSVQLMSHENTILLQISSELFFYTRVNRTDVSRGTVSYHLPTSKRWEISWKIQKHRTICFTKDPSLFFIQLCVVIL